MKFCVLVIFLVFPWISRVGDWALRWTEGNERVQIVFVMMLFPLIMNALQYYIIDSFIKKQADKADTEGRDASEGGSSRPGSEGGGEGYQRVAVADDGEETGIGPAVDVGGGSREGSISKVMIGSQVGTIPSPVHAEYDPEVDGDRTVVAGGGNFKNGPEGLVPKELLPKE